LFSNITPQLTPYVSFSRQQTRLGDDEVKELCEGLAHATGNKSYPTVVGTFSQNGGEWYASGVEQVYDTFLNIESRWESQSDWEQHKREMVTLSADVDDETTIFIGGQAAPSQTEGESINIKQPWMAIESNGIPITGDKIMEYSKQIGFEPPNRCVQTEIPNVTANDTEIEQAMHTQFGKEIITDRYTYSTDDNEEDWVIALRVQNPFHRQGLSQLVDQQETEFGHEFIDHILSRDHLIVVLGATHPLNDEVVSGYEINRMKIQNYTELLDGRSGKIYNIYIQVEYQTK
jgi:hypothetical protein